MTSPNDINIRFNFRIEVRRSTDEDPEAALLMMASQTRMTWRASSAYEPGTRISITGDPSFHDSYNFSATVSSCEHRTQTEQKMNYYEVSCEVEDSEEQYLPFLKRLRQTCHEMNDDMRLDVSLPVSLKIKGEKISTWCNNVSFGGLFIILKGTPMPKIKETVNLSISIYGKETPMECSGDVCYVINDEQASAMNITPGAGIRLNLSDEENFYWEQTIRTLHKEALG